MKSHKNKGSQQNLKVMKIIYTCIENGDIKRLKMIQNIENYVDLEYTDYGWNMIHLAAWFKQNTILEFILQLPEASNLINAQDKNQETPLHLAFFTESRQCIQTLMEHGANPEQENILHQLPIQIMTAPRESQYQTLLEIQKTLNNESQFNSINPYLNKLKLELEMERGSTTVPFEKQNDGISPIKMGNHVLEDDYQFLNTNKNSQKINQKDLNLLSFQSVSNNYNDEIIGLSNFGSQQNLAQSKIESMITHAKKHKGSDQDLQIDNIDSERKTFDEETKKVDKVTKDNDKDNLDDSDIQDEQKNSNEIIHNSIIDKFLIFNKKDKTYSKKQQKILSLAQAQNHIQKILFKNTGQVILKSIVSFKS